MSARSLLAPSIAIVFTAMLLRGPVTAVGPLAEAIVDFFGISYTQYGTLAAIPIAAFGLFSFAAAPLASRLGIKTAALAAIVVLFAGAAGRLCSNWNGFLLASLTVGAGIALLNVMLPVAIKNWFAGKTASMMGLYTGIIGLSGAFGGLTSVPLSELGGGIATTMLFWAAAAFVGAAVWLLLAPATNDVPKAAVAARCTDEGMLSLLKSPTAWALVFVMGLQSLLVYTVGAWLSPFLSAQGLPHDEAGFWFFVFLASGLPASILTPAFMRAVKSEAAAALILGVLYLAGIAGWLAGGWWLLPASISAGISQGSMLSVAFLLMAKKSDGSRQMLSMSALAQGLGYIGAGLGPLAFGMLLEKSASWPLAFCFAALAVVCWTAAGLAASRSSKL